MNDSSRAPVEPEAMGWTGACRRFLRDLAIECFAIQPASLKVWEMGHLRRVILGVLFRLEKNVIATARAGPSGHRFRMRLRWQAHTSYVFGLYEPEMIQVLEQYIRMGDVCVDLGAHVGYLSMIMARLAGPQGRVISFEPVQETCAALKDNIQLNRLQNVTIEQAAAGNAEGFIELVCTKGEELSWTASATGYSLPGEESRISVPVVSLDRYLSRNRIRPRLIKIDVEGGEMEVLRGARETLREFHPIVLVEIHDLGKQHQTDVLKLLESCGYAVISLATRDREILCLALPSHDKGNEGREPGQLGSVSGGHEAGREMAEALVRERGEGTS